MHALNSPFRRIALVAISVALGTLTGIAAAQTQYATTPDPNSQDYPTDQPGAPGDQAFENDGTQAEADPPSRVARVSLSQGAVSLEPAGSQDWANADVNRPLTTGDKLWTDQNSRAELDIGSAAIRLGGTTGFSFLNLDDHTAQMQVTAGTLIVRVRDLGENETFEIDTPNLAVALVQPGQYRVEVNEAGDTTVVEVSQGEAHASGSGQGFPIHAQQRAQFVGTDRLSSVVGTLGAPDDLDDWSLSRDRLAQNSQSQQYVSTEATGYSDLDNNGRWESTPDYGYVWTPTTIEAGWAPYRFGHWVWISPWGWTWVDNAPWGFAPFHYGRWVTYNNAWCWVPGPRRIRPVYAPALVGWIGRPGVGVSIAVGAGVSWFPLGPREVYVPAYRVTPGYVQRVNITNTTINRTYITNVYQNRATNITYVNRGARGGVTSVSQAVFTSAQPVWRNRMNIPESSLRNAQVSVVAPRIAPMRESLVGAGTRMNVRTPPPAVFNRTVLARTPPPRPVVSFDRQSEAIRANGGRPLGRGEIARLQPATPTPAPVRMIGGNRGPGGPNGVPGGGGAGFGNRGPGSNNNNNNGNNNPAFRGRGLDNAPANNEPSLGDRERAIRDNRLGGGTPPPRNPGNPGQNPAPNGGQGSAPTVGSSLAPNGNPGAGSPGAAADAERQFRPRVGRPDRPPSVQPNQAPQPNQTPQPNPAPQPQPNAEFNRPRPNVSEPSNPQNNERSFDRPNTFQRGEQGQRPEQFQRPDRFQRPSQPPPQEAPRQQEPPRQQEAPRFERSQPTPQPRVVDPPRQAPQVHAAPPPPPPPAAPQVHAAPTPPPQQQHNEPHESRAAPRGDRPGHATQKD